MIGYGPPIWAHLLLWALMILTLTSLRVGGMRDGWVRRRQERARLRIALIAELRALRAAYRINQPFWRDGQPGMSGRAFFAMFRGNMGRLLLLPEAEVAVVVRAYAASEALDEAMALRARAGKHRGHDTGSDTKVGQLEVVRLQRAARGNCRIALEVLAAAATEDASRVSWRAWCWERLRRLAGRPPAPVAPLAQPVAEVITLSPLPPRAEARTGT